MTFPIWHSFQGKQKEELTEELAGVIFKNPIGEKWEPSDEYSFWKCEGETADRKTVCRRSPGISGECAVFGAGTAKRSGCIRD